MSTLHATRVDDLRPGDLARGILNARTVTGAPVRVRTVRPVGGRYRVSYVIFGTWSTGWRDLDGTRGVTVERP